MEICLADYETKLSGYARTNSDFHTNRVGQPGVSLAQSELPSRVGIVVEVIAGHLLAFKNITQCQRRDRRRSVWRRPRVGVRRVIDEAGVIAAENDVAVFFADKTEPSRVIPRLFRQFGKLHRREIMIETRLKAPDRSAARNKLRGEQTQTMKRAGCNASFDQHHASRIGQAFPVCLGWPSNSP